MVRELVRPSSIREAVRLRARPGSAYLGGGTWLLSRRSATGAGVLISLEKLGLDFVEPRDGQCRIGACTTFQQAIDAPAVPEVVRNALRCTASRTLRNMMTIGGELGLRPADSALLPVLIALEATMRLAGHARPVPVEEYCRGAGGDLVLEVIVPADRACGLRAVSRTAGSPRSLVVAVAVETPRIVASDCRGQLCRFVELEEEIAGSRKPGGTPPDRLRIEQAVKGVFFPTPDAHASADYKRYLAAVLLADLLGASP